MEGLKPQSVEDLMIPHFDKEKKHLYVSKVAQSPFCTRCIQGVDQ